ncbi:MAG: FAD-dependent oxidoreductase [Clostridia bacterium]|nr:FAD-dependent oxidoreductase [Clostridia bacterium]
MKTISLSKEVPVIDHFDTVVCGGGPAGWVAALAAARAGKKTALIERFGFLGGTATAGYVIPLSGCFFHGERVVGGITWEFITRMTERKAAQVELPKGHVSLDPEAYKLLAWQMVEEAGVTIYSNAYLSGCHTDGRHVTHVFFESKNGTEAIEGDVFIDATGDGDLCHMANVQMLPQTNELQPLSMCFLLSGVDTSTDLLRDHIRHDGVKCKQSVVTEIHDKLQSLVGTTDVPQFGGPWFNVLECGDLLTVNITRSGSNAADRAELTHAEAQMRKDAFRLVELLKENFPEFKNAVIAATAVSGGVRETRHIRALHTLKGQDIQSSATYPDSVACCSHPMDIHCAGDNDQILIHLNAAGRIPFRTMVPFEYDNLLAAGRCISADREAYASMRVQANVMALGEAAGIASSLYNPGDSFASVDIDKLHELLDKAGCIY